MSDAMIMGNRANNVPRGSSEAPTPPILTGGTVAVVQLQQHGRLIPSDVTPVHTVRAGGHHHALVMRNNGVGEKAAGAMLTPSDEPVRALTVKGHQSIVLPYYRTATASGDQVPAPTVTTRDRLALLVPAGGGWADAPTLADREPAPTQLAREHRGVVFTDDDIDNCRFRMFALHEIAGAMAMHRHPNGGAYEVFGNKREQMAQFGNSVTPPAMATLVRALGDAGYDVSRILDLFCGAGGSGTGARLGGGSLVLGLNHWQRAIETYGTNHPEAEVDCEDISSLTTHQIKRYQAFARPTGMIAGPECTNHSIAKGGRRVKPQAASLFDDGPAGNEEQEKSRATMWDVLRFTEQAIISGHPLEWMIVENVVDAFKWGANDDGGLFSAWLIGLDNLGYHHEIVWLNSMFAPPSPDPAPQSRDRMYIVFWRKGGRTPDLKVRPPAWCPCCEKVVAGVQTWKKPEGRAWGRYGAQYVYACSECRSPAFPGAFPADWIIDRSLHADRIADRKIPLASNTRDRILRGLIRVFGEPFAIRLLAGGTPKPLTLPLVTQTTRHDMAMVIPVAGNTFERTPGNRARDVATQPADTVHTTLDRALVMANTENGVPRAADEQPAQTLRTEGGLAMVVPPMGSVTPRSSLEPAPTQTTTTRAGIVTKERVA